MPEDSRHYESEIVRVQGGSGRWEIVGIAAALLVLAVGIGGTLLAPGVTEPDIAVVDQPPGPVDASPAPSVETVPGPVVAAAPPLDITSGASGYAAAFEARRRRSIPLIIESTDFHANGGAAYYGIGGKLLRALGPTPSPTTSPTPATP